MVALAIRPIARSPPLQNENKSRLRTYMRIENIRDISLTIDLKRQERLILSFKAFLLPWIVT
jgi:hypothetical protein